MKKLFLVIAIALLVILSAIPASGGGIDDPPGVPLYVIIEVTWDGDTNHDGSWTVHGPAWGPPTVDGPVLASCSIGPLGSCLEMSYEFIFRGKTVQFDEIYVPTVNAKPQLHHVVLSDLDGDGTYVGSLSAQCYELDPSAILYVDRIDYEVTFDEDGNVDWFYYLQYEHKKME